MKIIFLDIDGVLNSIEFWARHIAAGGRGGYDGIDHVAVSRLNRLVEASGARVVLSSAWRKGGVESAQQALRAKGATWTIHATTPVLESGDRFLEIWTYIAHSRGYVTNFVILDDELVIDLDVADPWLVQTDRRVGLTDEDVERALAILGPAVPEPPLATR